MTLPFQYSGGTTQVKVYNVTGYDQEKLPDWLLSKNRKQTKKDGFKSSKNAEGRLELIQDFEFPSTSQCIKFSKNGKYIVGTGAYKPQIRVWDTSQCSLKFERHTDAETVCFELLEDDWTKLLLLQTDRSLEFHTQGGIYYTTRIPKAGRDLLYDTYTAEAVAVGSSSEIYRLSLHQGRFMKPIESNMQYINSVRLNPCHRLMAVGGSSGIIEYFDLRQKTSVGNVRISAQEEVTCLEFLPDGMTIATGSSSGVFRTFDLRMSSNDDHEIIQALMARNFHGDSPVTKINIARDRMCGEEPILYYVSDGKTLKVWNRDSGDLKLSLEKPSSAARINDFSVSPETPGFFAVALDSPQLQSYFVPALGPAPRWASYLDALTEELEESEQPTLYDHYKFITTNEVHSLGLSNLLNTQDPNKKQILKPYMHGYLIDYKHYEQLRSIMNPFEFDEYKKKKQLDKLEKERASRISGVPSLPEVNKKLFKKKGDIDPRFASVYEDPEFEIDEESHEYKLIHPSETRKQESSDEEDYAVQKAAPENSDSEGEHPTRYSYNYTGMK